MLPKQIALLNTTLIGSTIPYLLAFSLDVLELIVTLLESYVQLIGWAGASVEQTTLKMSKAC